MVGGTFSLWTIFRTFGIYQPMNIHHINKMWTSSAHMHTFRYSLLFLTRNVKLNESVYITLANVLSFSLCIHECALSPSHCLSFVVHVLCVCNVLQPYDCIRERLKQLYTHCDCCSARSLSPYVCSVGSLHSSSTSITWTSYRMRGEAKYSTREESERRCIKCSLSSIHLNNAAVTKNIVDLIPFFPYTLWRWTKLQCATYRISAMRKSHRN